VASAIDCHMYILYTGFKPVTNAQDIKINVLSLLCYNTIQCEKFVQCTISVSW